MKRKLSTMKHRAISLIRLILHKIISENNFGFVWDNLAEAVALKCRERTSFGMKIDAAIIDEDGKILGSFHDE